MVLTLCCALRRGYHADTYTIACGQPAPVSCVPYWRMSEGTAIYMLSPKTFPNTPLSTTDTKGLGSASRRADIAYCG